MHKKIKYIISLILSLITLLGVGVSAYAMEPRYSDASETILRINFDGTTAICTGKIIGAIGTTSITDFTMALKDSNNKEIFKLENLSSGSIMSVEQTAYNLVRGETYTLTVSAKVHRNGNIENVSESVSKTCPED